MCLGRHCYGGVGYTRGDLGKSVACAGRDYQCIKRFFRAERLGIGYGTNNLTTANSLHARKELGGKPKSGVGGAGALADDRLNILA